MTPEILGFKSTTFFPALVGAIIYAIRAAEQSILARLSGGITGFFTAAYVGPAIIDHLSFSPEVGSGIIFVVGVSGAVLIETAWGILKNPAGFYRALKKYDDKNDQ